MMDNGTATLVWDSKCTVGEGCVWDAAQRRVLFCDIPAGRIHALSPEDGTRRSWQLPELVGSFGLCRSGRLVVALKHRIVLFDLQNETVEPLAGPIDEPDNNRFNDGKVGPDGCFWVGTMNQDADRKPTGALYRVRPDGVIERKASGYGVSNGLAWSPDGRVMYHADTPPGRVDAWRFDPATGEIGERRVFAQLSRDQGLPDGAATDAAGGYWSAGVTAGCLNRFDAQGRLTQTIRLPIATPTMPCFAEGWVFVTSLRRADAAADQDTAGGLLRLAAPVAGAPVGLFADR